MKTDVVVLGGGVAGTVAALRARAAGRQVIVVSMGWGATALSSGCIGFARQSADGPVRSGRDAMRALGRACRLHPYHLIADAADGLAEAVRFFRAGPASPALKGDSPDGRPLVIADDRGGLRLTDLAVDACGRGDLAALSDGGTVGVLDPIGLSWFQAHSVAKALGDGLSRATDAGLLRAHLNVLVIGLDYFRRQSDSLTTAADSARLLDGEDSAARFSAAVGEALSLTPVQLLLVPPLVGIDATDAILDRIEAENRVVCAELVGTAPGAAGIRFQRALEAMLAHAGVGIIRARAWASPESRGALSSGRENRPLERVLYGDVDVAKQIEARAFVLASGRFIGGGVGGSRPWSESVLGFPVAADGEFLERESSAGLTRVGVFDGQPLFAAGVRVDSDLRPLGRDARPRYTNLFAAGDVVSGHDGVADGSAMGVALLTGHIAGRNAAAM